MGVCGPRRRSRVGSRIRRSNAGTRYVSRSLYGTAGLRARDACREGNHAARADTGYYLRAARALIVARTDFGARDRPYNEAVIPAAGDTWWVYRSPAPTCPNVWPLGGDVRYHISSDGRSILEKRTLHLSIMEGNAAQRDSSVARGSPVSRMHTAVVDQVPEDTDVLFVLERQPPIPEYVLAVPSGLIYVIDVDGSIRFCSVFNKNHHP